MLGVWDQFSFSSVEPEYSGAVQLSQSVTAVGPLLHRLVALCPTEGAVPGDPHALDYLQVDTLKNKSKGSDKCVTALQRWSHWYQIGRLFCGDQFSLYWSSEFRVRQKETNTAFMGICLGEKMHIKTLFFFPIAIPHQWRVFTQTWHAFSCFCRLRDPGRLNRSQRFLVWLADMYVSVSRCTYTSKYLTFLR